MILGLTFLTIASAGAEEYKRYERESTSKAKIILELIVSQQDWEFVLHDNVQSRSYIIPTDEIEQVGDRINCGGEVEISGEGFRFGDHLISFDQIGRARVRAGSSGTTVIKFEHSKKKSSPSSFQRKKKDKFSFFNDVVIDEDQFILGSVISFFGDIDVFGEVNDDVVAISGDIFVAEDAVVRGDVIAVSGKVKVDKDASIYGEISSPDRETSSRRSRARKWKKFENAITLDGTFSYNRVDGLFLMSGFEYEHRDSLLPSFHALGGYAFASKRWRYRIDLTQTLVRGQMPLQIGGSYYRILKTADEKLIESGENTVFALMVNEDWRDYYEAEGGYLFVRTKFLGVNKFEVGYRSEKQNWLDSHAKLWSVFGNKDFRENFSSVPYDIKQAHLDDFDGAQVTSLILEYKLDSRDDEEDPSKGWYGTAHYESSPEKWKGDFDFKQVELHLLRYQSIGRYLSLRMAGAYGYTEGSHIPLNRQFFLGGLGTMHGYRHKEFMGKEYVFGSAEYCLRVPHSDISPFIKFDAGRIATERLSSVDSWKSSIGFGVNFGNDLKIFLSQRLDKGDEDPVFYARLSVATF